MGKGTKAKLLDSVPTLYLPFVLGKTQLTPTFRTRSRGALSMLFAVQRFNCPAASVSFKDYEI